MSTWTSTEPYPSGFVPALLTETWKRHLAKQKPAESGPDGFPIYADNPRRAEHALLTAFIAETWKSEDFKLEAKDFPSGRAILNLDKPAKTRVILAIAERYPWFWKTAVEIANLGDLRGFRVPDCAWRWKLGRLLTALMRSPPPFSVEEFMILMTALAEPPQRELLFLVEPKGLIRIAQTSWPDSAPPAAVKKQLEELEHYFTTEYFRNRTEDRKVMEGLRALLGKARPEPVKPGEAWSDAVLAELNQMPATEADGWQALLAHCKTAEASKPAKKWISEAGEFMDKIGRAKFKERALRWFELVALPRTAQIDFDPKTQTYSPDPNLLICEENATILRGLAWCLAGWADAEVSSALSALAEVCFKKVRWLGPRCPRVGNACLHSLSTTTSEAAAAQLSRLDSTVKQPTAKKRIGKSLDTAASLTGQTREDLEEKSVPSFDLSAEGTLVRHFGEFTATLRVIQSRDVEIEWSKQDGKAIKSVPADVKRSCAAELKQFQKLAKDVEKMLAAQRIRIERLLMTERSWDFESWRQRYLNHLLLAGLSRRLIWHFQLGNQSALGIWLNGKIADVKGRPLDWLAPETRVRLWHPIGFPAATVAAWREFLSEHEICQPFKQAHREIYVLTDAEIRTRNYSNRFAAHILGQHQFAALCGQRAWKYAFMGGFDSQSVPTLALPAWNMSAEFWVDPAGELADSGVATHLATDQVRFVRNEQPLLLSDVPAIVFSEVMRDVDLFVGVGSIGNDPAWRDQGEIAGANDYWQNFSFGDLNASAETRREVLERLLPKLKIAAQCSLEKRFLVVRGQLRTYKIHLGSSNIQMLPNDQYLCIVPDRVGSAKGGNPFFLPFEGDRTLSIILSKAFLLAEDNKIKDQSILSQIKTR